MNHKKMMSILTATTLAVTSTLAFTGCGSGEGDKQGGGSSTASAGATVSGSEGEAGGSELGGELTLWYNAYTYADELDSLIAAFNQQYPNVKVSYEIKNDNDYISIVKTAFQAGTGPDMLWTHGTKDTLMPDLVANGALMDLSDVVDFSFCQGSAMDICTIDEGIYSIPWLTLDTRTCYYNKDLFEEHGWEVPSTLGELEKLCQEIKDTTDIIPLSQALSAWYLEFLYEPMLAAYDPEYSAQLADYSVSVTAEPAREALQKLVDWADAGYFGDNWTGVQTEDAMVLGFASGTSAMMITGSWDNSLIMDNNPELNFGAVNIGNDESGAVGLIGAYSSGFSLNKNSKNPEAAIAFANFCASKEAQQIWIQQSEAVSGSPEIESTNEIAKEMVDTSNGEVYEAWQTVLSAHSKDAIATTVFSDNLTKVFTHEITVDEYMDMIAAEME